MFTQITYSNGYTEMHKNSDRYFGEDPQNFLSVKICFKIMIYQVKN